MPDVGKFAISLVTTYAHTTGEEYYMRKILLSTAVLLGLALATSTFAQTNTGGNGGTGGDSSATGGNGGTGGAGGAGGNGGNATGGRASSHGGNANGGRASSRSGPPM